MVRILSLALPLLVPTPAFACMSEPLPHAIVFSTQPTPEHGTFAIKVDGVTRQPDSYDLKVRVVEGPPDLRNRKLRVQPENIGSCTSPGRVSGYVVVRRNGTDGRLIGLAYTRSWTDWIAMLMGWGVYYFPGQYAPPLKMP
jgi:hypothetical protein